MSKILDWRGRGLKLNSRADFEPLIKDVDPATVEEIHLGGNTLGVDAAQALGEFLQKANHLKASYLLSHFCYSHSFLCRIYIGCGLC